MTDMTKCKKCGHEGHIVNVGGLFYAQCTHCHKWDMYQFLGISPKGAANEWNRFNSTGKIVEDDYA